MSKYTHVKSPPDDSPSLRVPLAMLPLFVRSSFSVTFLVHSSQSQRERDLMSLCQERPIYSDKLINLQGVPLP